MSKCGNLLRIMNEGSSELQYFEDVVKEVENADYYDEETRKLLLDDYKKLDKKYNLSSGNWKICSEDDPGFDTYAKNLSSRIKKTGLNYRNPGSSMIVKASINPDDIEYAIDKIIYHVNPEGFKEFIFNTPVFLNYPYVKPYDKWVDR